MKTSVVAFAQVLLATVVCLGPHPAHAEIQLTEAYNRLYQTEYDVVDYRAGIAKLTQERGLTMKTHWTLKDVRYIQMLVWDSGARGPLNLVVGDVSIPLFDPGPWTHPSRGWLPEVQEIVNLDLFGLMSAHGITDPYNVEFSFALGTYTLTADNTLRVQGLHQDGQFLLATNDNGSLSAGDGDVNEPIFLCIQPLATRL